MQNLRKSSALCLTMEFNKDFLNVANVHVLHI